MNDKKIKVTIIVPVYNTEKYLKQCIESVLRQTLKEIEIICIDDGSTDCSLEILKEYEKKDSRIVVYSKSNTGYGHTINYGLKKSRGEYISIVESDDFIDEEGIERLYNCAEKNKADYVRANYYEYSNKGDLLNESLNVYTYNKVVSALEDLNIFIYIPCSPWGCIYKKDFLDKSNLRMNETPGASYQDTSWTFILLLKAKRIVFLKEAYYHYRMDNENASVNSQKKVFCIVDEKEYMERKLLEYQISDKRIFDIFSKLIYGSYKWNYSRISGEFQYAFLIEWKKEILRQKETGILKKESFDDKQWKEINCILNNMNDYFERTAKVYEMKDVYENSINDKLYYEAFINKIIYNKIIIFGTGIVAKELVNLLKRNAALENVICFCELSQTKEEFEGKQVFSVAEFPYSKEILLICATFEKTQKNIMKELVDEGFLNILCIDKILREKMKIY